MYTTAELCAAAEKQCGYNTIEGAQRIGGLWRLYPRTKEARQSLLLQGFVARGVTVTVQERNPFVTNPSAGDPAGDRESNQPPSTKLIIGNVPLSFSDVELLNAVKAMGVTVFSKLVPERDRDAEGKLTHWKTGRRFVYIAVPNVPLPKAVPIGPFRASLYHREQRTADRQKEAECRKCLSKGHRAADCTAPIKCRQCFQDGHKAGDPSCPRPAVQPEDSYSTAEEDSAAPSSRRQSRDASCRSEAEDRPERSSRPRSKPKPKQQKQQTKLTAYRRDSSSAKRRRSLESTAPQTDKQRRLETRSDEESDCDENPPSSVQSVWG